MIKEDKKTFIKELYKNEMANITWGEFRNFNRFGFNAEIFEKEEEVIYSINRRKIESVIDKVCNDPSFIVDEDFETSVMKAHKFCDINLLDATDIDYIFQLAIFNDIRY
jgi:hypothetical protein